MPLTPDSRPVSPRRSRFRLLLCTPAIALALWLTPGSALALQPAPVVAPKPAAESVVEPREFWYTLWIDGVRSGYSRHAVIVAEDRITTETRTSLSIKRGPVDMTIIMDSAFVESHDGEPIWASSEQRIGALPTKTMVEFKGDELEITRVQGRTTATETVKAPTEPWLPPAAAERYTRHRMRANASEIVVRTLDPATGLVPITVTLFDFKDDTELVAGHTIQTRLSRATTSYMPGVETVQEFDLEGVPVRTQTEMAGMRIDSVISDERTALAEVKGGAEVMARSLIKPDRPIKKPRSLEKSSLLLSISSGTMPELPSAGSQRVESIDARTSRLIINTVSPAPAPQSDITNAALTASTLMCQSDDELIRELTLRATAHAGPDKAKRAEAIRRFVRSYLNRKSLDVGFASASETARSRAGDCSEHAVLLAAMLRADGIPARGVTGLVYVDEFLGESGIFGYHMWTQALLNIDGAPTWIDLDAAIDDTHAFDATHIACSLVTYADSETIEAFQAIIPLMGSLDIKVESAE